MMRVTRSEHDACLRAAWRIREQINRGERTAEDADADLVALNIVAGAYSCNERVSRKHYFAAMRVTGGILTV